MKLILTAEVDHLGVAGDTVEVKDGYGRNYLLPRGLAIVATRGAQKQADEIRRARDAKRVHDREHADEIKAALSALGPISLPVKTHDSGKLFGSVSANDIAVAIKKAGGPNIDKRAVHLPKAHIKATGTHTVAVPPRPSRGIVCASESPALVPTQLTSPAVNFLLSQAQSNTPGPATSDDTPIDLSSTSRDAAYSAFTWQNG